MAETTEEQNFNRGLRSAKRGQARKPFAGGSLGLGAAAVGAPGQAINKVAQRVAGGAVSRSAYATAKRLRQTKRFQRSEEKTKVGQKKLTGTAFYMMIGLTLAKDISDGFLGVTLVLSLAIFFTSMFVSYAVLVYLIVNNVKFSARKLVSYFVALVFEMTPLGILPLATINLVLLRVFENSEYAQKIAASKVAKHIA